MVQPHHCVGARLPAPLLGSRGPPGAPDAAVARRASPDPAHGRPAPSRDAAAGREVQGNYRDRPEGGGAVARPRAAQLRVGLVPVLTISYPSTMVPSIHPSNHPPPVLGRTGPCRG
eukprot:scaffold766_cov560-Prasinococcus_capsulatus_cf.AAC.6